MLKVTKTALVVSALTLGLISVAHAAPYNAHIATSNGHVYNFRQAEDVTTIRSLANYGAAFNAGLDVNQSTVDVINTRALAGNKNMEVWATPVYSKSSRSYSTKADGSYDVDVSLTGINLGFEKMNQINYGFGAIFNFGKVSTDGEGRARFTENDADYFSFGLYGMVNWDKLNVTVDMVLSQVSNDLEGDIKTNSSLGKVKADVDTNEFSMGVTGNYTFNTAFADITPHLALRYTSLELDGTNYDVTTPNGVISRNSIESVDIFSIPVGVTVSKSIQTGDWCLAPKFDVTLTSNFGDDKYKYTTIVRSDDLALPYFTEDQKFIDSFTYVATLGLDAKYKDCLDLGLGVGYTGSSNSDKFNVTANIGYNF